MFRQAGIRGYPDGRSVIVGHILAYSTDGMRARLLNALCGWLSHCKGKKCNMLAFGQVQTSVRPVDAVVKEDCYPCMSRVLNLSIDMAETTSLCDKHSIGISTIKPLDSGGTRIVLMSSGGAVKLTSIAKAHLISGPVTRSSLYRSRLPVPYN